MVKKAGGKTSLWFVQIVPAKTASASYRLAVGLEPLPAARHTLKIRTITARAAVRKYIRDNLPAQAYLFDDGSHEIGDLFHHNYFVDESKRRENARYARRLALPSGASGWCSFVAAGDGPGGYDVLYH